ncbi:DUF427 domain-containing protein [Methylomicrobium agile]|uniref:DUF427 domain-containing protein n=1 Tax=Methylomicrobium agile TaxID=39774 RepID=UPI0004DEEA46|nr:DUF427 domain-containing protein [Methylomicrobium agile]
MKALWNNAVIADSDEVIEIEGNCYFPPASVHTEFLRESATHTVCPWKGQASYCDIVANGATNPDAAWYYPEPKEKASSIKNYIAFQKGVEIAA